MVDGVPTQTGFPLGTSNFTPPTSRCHLRWARLPDVLSSGQGGDQQCYDGSSSIVMRSGVLSPMLMIDGGCGEKVMAARAARIYIYTQQAQG